MTPTELKTAREGMGISQEGLAKIIGIHPRTLRRYETGYYVIPKTVALLMDMLVKDWDSVACDMARTDDFQKTI